MSPAKRIALWSAALVFVVSGAGAAKVTRDEAHRLLPNPRDVDAKKWIAAVSPRPVLIMQGGADQVVSVSSGQRM